MATMRISGPVLKYDRTPGTSKAGNQYVKTTVRVLVADTGVAEIVDFTDTLPVLDRGEIVDYLAEVSVYAGNLNVTFAGETPAEYAAHAA